MRKDAVPPLGRFEGLLSEVLGGTRPRGELVACSQGLQLAGLAEGRGARCDGQRFAGVALAGHGVAVEGSGHG